MSSQNFSVEQLRRRTEVVVAADVRQRVLVRVEGRVRRRQRVRRALAVGAAVAMVAGGALWRFTPPKPLLVTHAPSTPAGIVVVEAGPALIHFDDRSTGRPATKEARTRVAERSTTLTVVALEAGAVSFDVVHGTREFRVRAGSIEVIVLGTAFLVDRQTRGVQVTVTRGRVRVENHGVPALVDVGETRWFAFDAPSASEPKEKQATAARWRTLARRGEFNRAYELLARTDEPPKDAVEDLLLAADVARRSNHFAEALPYYDRVIQAYGRDPRASLAALTKGRIALRKLRDGRIAAAALEQARLLSLPPSLAEESLADEVEAWVLAGDPARARAAAEEYAHRYPSGAAIDRVRRLGLERP